jgi:ribosomal protein S27AE
MSDTDLTQGDVHHSSNRLCPYCGAELDTFATGVYYSDEDDIEELTQSCPDCGWTSDPYYE